jgi:hypothetical protein
VANFDDLFTPDPVLRESSKTPPSKSISFKMSPPRRLGTHSHPTSPPKAATVPIAAPKPPSSAKDPAIPIAAPKPLSSSVSQPKSIPQPETPVVRSDLEPLVQQIVKEVMQQIHPFLPSSGSFSHSESAAEVNLPLVNRLQAQLDLLQLRYEKMSQQIQNYEAEIEQLQEEKLLLEQTMIDLPEIYRQKFAARMEPVRQRIREIQAENRQLRSDVYELSFRLHQQSSPAEPIGWRVRLPQMPKRRALPSGA